MRCCRMDGDQLYRLIGRFVVQWSALIFWLRLDLIEQTPEGPRFDKLTEESRRLLSSMVDACDLAAIRRP